MNADVLVVDDDRDLRETVAMLLEDVGYRVALARDGRDALALLGATATLPRLILLDLSMPIMNGMEFRSRQLADVRLAPVPVVVLSASGRIEAQTGVNVRDALAKPFSPDRLLELVARYCPPPPR